MPHIPILAELAPLIRSLFGAIFSIKGWLHKLITDRWVAFACYVIISILFVGFIWLE